MKEKSMFTSPSPKPLMPGPFMKCILQRQLNAMKAISN